MLLDNEVQQRMILAAINATTWPGQMAEEVVKLKIAVAAASIAATKPPEEVGSGIED